MSEEMSAFRGVTRRDFLKYCTWLAGVMGLGEAGMARVASALEAAARRPSVVWSSFQVCTGCAIQLLQAREPTVQNLILQQISLDYQDNVMAAAGSAAEEVLRQVTEGEDFYWVVEGSVATGIPGAMTVAGRTSMEVVDELYPKANATIAMGSCAAYGNIQAARPNPTGAKGIAAYLREDGGVADPVVVNLPRCPGHGDDLIATLTYALVNGELPELDAVGRPVFLYGQTIHDTCFRRGHFEAGRFVERFGDESTGDRDWCLYKVGCKGPVTYAPCGRNLWNGNVSWCVNNAPCQGCAEPDFWDELTPFYDQVRGGDLPGLYGVTAEQIGIGLGIATAAGLAAHGVGTAIRSRRTTRAGEPGRREGGEL
ncbi:MAG: hydrogenase small subunit [Coriobacteriia bacterium]|nr:hydrogenase small subunit [Coriobacteriia bacterium]